MPIKRYFKRYSKLSRNVIALSAVSFLNDTSSDIIYPLLPAFLAVTLGASPFAIGVIEGFAESISSILKLFAGYLSDKFGSRKIPVLFGYSVAAIARPLLAFASSWEQVFLVRLADRLGKGIRAAPRDALLASSVSAKKRGLAFGFNRAADHLGAVVGPIIAFVFLYFLATNYKSPTAEDYRFLFLFASVPIGIGLLIIYIFVRDKGHAKNEESIEKPQKLELSLKNFDGGFKRFLLIIALFTLSNSTDAFLILRAQQAGIAIAIIPLLWAALSLSKVASSLVFGDLSDRVGRKKLIFIGWILYSIVYIGFAFVGNSLQALGLFLVYGIYFGLTEGAEKALVADLVPSKMRGTAYGLYNLAIGITVFPASLLFGLIWNQYGAAVAFISSAVISTISAFLILTIREKKSVTDPATG